MPNSFKASTRRWQSSTRYSGFLRSGWMTDSGSISPISLMLETICLYLRVLITPSGTFLLGSNWSSGIW